MILLGAICFIVGGVVIALAKAGVGTGSSASRARQERRLLRKDKNKTQLKEREYQNEMGNEKDAYYLDKKSQQEIGQEWDLEFKEKRILNNLSGDSSKDARYLNYLNQIYNTELSENEKLEEFLTQMEIEFEKLEAESKHEIKEDIHIVGREKTLKLKSKHDAAIREELKKTLNVEKEELDDERKIESETKEEERIDKKTERKNKHKKDIIYKQLKIVSEHLPENYDHKLIVLAKKKHHLTKEINKNLIKIKGLTGKEIHLIKKIEQDADKELKFDKLAA